MAIIGGGLAGLAAAVALGAHGVPTVVLESRPRLGGRASSFADPSTGQTIDACQHVGMSCCTNLGHFFSTVGAGHFFEPEPALTFMTPDGRTSRFGADPLPAPLHLGRALLGAHYLSAADKLRIGYGLMAMWAESPTNDEPLLPWLLRHRQSPRALERFWGLVLVSALNETLDRAGLRYARQVFAEGFLRHRKAFTVQVPTVPLSRLYGAELAGWLARHGAAVRLQTGVRRVELTEGGSLAGVTLRDGSTVPAAEVVLAVPFGRAAELLPELDCLKPVAESAAKLEPSPITSVHVWFDRPITPHRHLVLVDCLGQWLFRRDGTGADGVYYQVVISAARHLQGLGHAEIGRRVIAELGAVFPAARTAAVLSSRVVTEHSATYGVAPGVDALRPDAESGLPGLVVAGDWARTGWPATMEGAVRSGYLAAQVLLERRGVIGGGAELVRPSLGVRPKYGWGATS